MTTQLTAAKQLISALGGDDTIVTEEFIGLLARRLGYQDTVLAGDGEIDNPKTELDHIKTRLLELAVEWVNQQYIKENPVKAI